MKIFLVLLVVALCSVSLVAQDSEKVLQNRREKLLNAYFQHRDTMTIRTWMNVVKLNFYLEEIRKIDSVLLIGNTTSLQKPYQMISDLQVEIDSLKSHNSLLKNRKITIKSGSSFASTTFLFTILISVIFLVLFVFLFFGYSGAKNKARLREGESRDYLVKLNDANDEIEKMQQTQDELVHKMNVLQTRHEEDLRLFFLDKSAFADEKILLENQMIEVKKAYDFEVVKRKEIESQMILSNQQSLLIENRDAEEKKDDKIRVLEIENEEVKRALKMAINTLENEVLIRKNAEDVLNALIAQLEKAGFLQPENHSLLNISDQMKSYQNLLDDNKSLSNDVTRFRLNYENELKIKQQMKEDLAQIITKIKTNVSE